MLIEDGTGTTNHIITKGLLMELKPEITAEGSNDTGLPPIDH